MAAGDRERLLAEHNLHVSFGEIRRVKQAIKSGTLMELVAARAHAHPSTLDGYRALLDHSDQLEASDPASKDAFFTRARAARAAPKSTATTSASTGWTSTATTSC